MKMFLIALLTLIFVSVALGQNNETMKIKLYFTDEVNNPGIGDCSKVRFVERAIPKTKAPATAALKELFKGATEKEIATGLAPAFTPENADIFISVNVKNGAAFVNLRKSIEEKMSFVSSTCGGMAFHSSILATLRQFPTIDRVYYAIEGSPREYYDWTQAGDCPEEIKKCSGKNFIRV
jgi:spore germination protein GerM